MHDAQEKSREVSVNVVARGKDKPDRIIGIRTPLELLPHRLRYLVLHAASSAIIANHKKTELRGIGRPGAELTGPNFLVADGNFVRVGVVWPQTRQGHVVRP